MSSPLEIILEPHELQPSLVREEKEYLVLNSPWLVSSDILSGEEAIRLALAEALYRRTQPAATNPVLPGASRFVTAIQTVLAAQQALSPEAQARLYKSWQAQMAERWRSPFLTELVHPDEVERAQQADIAARILAAYLYRRQGQAFLVDLLRRLPSIATWDDLFQATLHHPTLLLEKEAAEAALDISNPNASLPSGASSSIPSLPLVGVVASGEAQAAAPRVICRFWPPSPPASPDIAGQTKPLLCFIDEVAPGIASSLEPLPVELPEALRLSLAEGQSFPAACAPPDTRLEIEGNWLEAGQRLQVRQISIRDTTPVKLDPAPADTVAYLIEGTRSDPVALHTLSQTEGLQPLTALNESLKVFPLPVTGGEGPHFLFQRDLPGCQQAWFAHYEPSLGITGYWFAPAHSVRWVWRADRQDLMLFNPKENSLDYVIYETDGTITPRQVGVSNGPLAFLGWNTEAERLVATASWFNETYIGLFDMVSGQISSMALTDYQPLQGRRLSPNGNWLAYLGGTHSVTGPPDRLELLDLMDETNVTLVQVEKGEGLSSPSWSLYLAQPALAVLAGPVVAENLQFSRLLLASPDRPNHFTVVAQAAPGEQLAVPVFCSDGALLYRAEQEGHYRLLQHQPGLPAKTLLEFEQPLWPIACP